MWMGLWYNLRYHPNTSQNVVEKKNQNQEHLSPHQDLNPGYLEHKTVVLTTRFNANTVVPWSYGLQDGRNGPNHLGVRANKGKLHGIFKKKKYYYYYLKLKYNTFKPKYCIKQFIIIVTAVKAKKTESELWCSMCHYCWAVAGFSHFTHTTSLREMTVADNRRVSRL